MLGIAFKLLNSALQKDPLTYQHSRRVASYAFLMVRYLELEKTAADVFVSAALLHDIGKAQIPLSIINKPGRLTSTEYKLIQDHPLYGAEMVVKEDKLIELAPIILHHHERIDGFGYPHGLRENEIPKLSRMIAVLDAYDSMIEFRPYQLKRQPLEAMQELRRCSCSQFDQNFVNQFFDYLIMNQMEVYHVSKLSEKI